MKREIKIKILNHRFDENNLIQFLKIDLKNAEWMDSEEFVLNGDFYDVVATKQIFGQIVYYCYLDKHEKKIVKIETQMQQLLYVLEVHKAPFSSIKIFPIKAKSFCNVIKYYSELPSKLVHTTKIPTGQSSTKMLEFINSMIIPPQV